MGGLPFPSPSVIKTKRNPKLVVKVRTAVEAGGGTVGAGGHSVA